MAYERLLRTLRAMASICLVMTLVSCDGVLDPLGDPNGDDDTADDDDTTAADDDVADDDSAGPVDLDGDGWTEAAGDCDDGDPTVHPDADEVACDHVDNDCDGELHEEETDDDGDSYDECGGDCDDGDADVHPGATEVACDYIDNDCDEVLHGDEIDIDGDGYDECTGDCDEADPALNPGADEVACDGIDNDCDGAQHDDEVDLDGDGYDACAGDCDEADPTVNPDAAEIACDYIDNDCDGALHDDETDDDGDGYDSCTGDCDEADPALNPGATETACDYVDNDCDGALHDDETDLDGDGFDACNGDCDDTDPLLDPADLDGDGFSTCDGDCDDADAALDLVDVDGDGYHPCSGDCDEADSAVNPGAAELACDAIDNDCDGALHAEESDDDGDGYDECAGDCDDGQTTVYPGAPELCDRLDNDCDGTIPGDEADDDGDGWSVCADDCDDGDDSVNPGTAEIACDEVDNDCDGQGTGSAMAEVDGLEYTSFADAVDSAVDGSTIQICPGTHTEILEIPDNLEVTITSASGTAADTTLDGEGLHRTMVLGEDSVVALSDLTFVNGLGDRDLATGLYGGGGIFSASAFLSVTGCVFTDNVATGNICNGGAIRFRQSNISPDPAELLIDGCRFERNSTTNPWNGEGAAIYADSGASLSVTVIDSDFIDNEATAYGGALSLGGDTIDASISGSRFEVNRANSIDSGFSGGAIYADASGGEARFDISDSVFLQNEAYSGGALNVTGEPSSLSITDCDFEGNQAMDGEGGAGVIRDWETVEVSGTTFTGNDAFGSGGSLLLSSSFPPSSSVTVSDVVFDGSTSGNEGGAFTIHQSSDSGDIDVTLDQVTFTNNTTIHLGAAFDVHNGHWTPTAADISMTDCHFEDNVAWEGGAVSLWYGDVVLEMTDCSFISNEADYYASAMFMWASDTSYTATLTNVVFEDNVSHVATDEGGLITVPYNTSLTMDSCSVTGNEGGGAVIVDDPATSLYSIDTDWGSGADDNVPYDIRFTDDTMYTAFGASETFTCNVATGCI